MIRVLWTFTGTIAEFREALCRQRAQLRGEVTPDGRVPVLH
jgi:hypothetical protein